MKLTLSSLPHTWILDVDGTIVKHNGYKIDGYDTLLAGVKEFFASLPSQDRVILLTARKAEYLSALKEFLTKNQIRYDHIITDVPMGERILVNDNKPSGLCMSFAISKERNSPLCIPFTINLHI